MEKDGYAVTTDPESPPPPPNYANDRKGSVLGEAADLYGSVQTAEHYGYVERGLKSRHIQFIALGGTIGTGLFLGIGGALANYGPLSILLGYTLTGFAIFAMMQCLGEMATWLPLPGAIPQMCARYVDPAMGFAVGWNNWYSSALTLCAEISAAATVIGFWNDDINPSAWITIVIVLIICLNIFAVSIYGEAEFCFAAVKLVTVLGLLILSLVLMLGGGPNHDRLGFRYWKHPYTSMVALPFGTNPNTGRFLSMFSTLANAAFAYGGVEMVAVAAGEAENPRKNIPKAVRRVFWRILFFYVLGSLAIGVTVPYTAPSLTSDGPGARSSPWVIAMVNAGIPALPSIINAVILTSASSSANAFLYTGSRYLFALAQNGQAPALFLKCSKTGVPWLSVAFTASFSLLTYMSASAGSSTVFGWFQTLTTISSLFTWVSVCVAYIRFQKALAAQNVDRNSLVFKSPYQPYTAYFALIFFSIIILFNGWEVFTTTDGVKNWDTQDFVTAYVGIPIYFGFYLFWKIFKRTKAVKPSEADIWTGKAAVDAEVWEERVPHNLLERVWFWIA
ncbi:hypothetical protein EV356DRAFT_515477 [Viridothelium virens]|uniref:Amino acid permease/ SLC12A domain-containing protein n=1 Tax=Viridothelium virens TaxID=1048519 RepID=A0A6A6HML6_VIRVR|nr:hypothetical protein EV356DRAFT_515477 [Viridothelium virens]